MTNDSKFMAVALKEAKKGLYQTWPNPAVGAVIVKGNRIVATGWHRRAGSDHAEVVALKKAGKKAAGCTMYVSLEPCNHTGLTPPCTQAVIKAGIKRLVYALADPNPRAGGGAAYLKKHRIQVTGGVLEQEAAEINRHFIFALRHRRPWMTLKAAVSLDGRAGMKDGRSKWITSPQAREDARKLRATCQAVVVGGATVARDNPTLLPPRLIAGNIPPWRIVLDWKQRVSGTEKVFHDSWARRTLWVGGQPTAKKMKGIFGRGARHLVLNPKGNLAASMKDFCGAAHHLGLRRLWVEGGPQILGACLEAGLAEELYLYQAPKVFGSRGSRPVFEGTGAAGPRGLADLKNVSIRKIGPDTRFHGFFV